MDKQQRLAELKSRIRLMERRPPLESNSIHFGVSDLDGALGDSGLPLACVHEVYGDDAGTTSAAGFIAAILTLLRPAPTVWIATDNALYLPGLHPFGINTDNLLFVAVRNAKDGLWAMEEALRWPGLRAVVAELDRFDLTATRRLQLAAEESGVTGFILARREQGLSSGVTRWQVSPAPATDASTANWHVTLSRSRTGRTASCMVQWQQGFVVRTQGYLSRQQVAQ